MYNTNKIKSRQIKEKNFNCIILINAGYMPRRCPGLLIAGGTSADEVARAIRECLDQVHVDPPLHPTACFWWFFLVGAVVAVAARVPEEDNSSCARIMPDGVDPHRLPFQWSKLRHQSSDSWLHGVVHALRDIAVLDGTVKTLCPAEQASGVVDVLSMLGGHIR